MKEMYKMHMVWIVVAESLRSGHAESMEKNEIIRTVWEKFQKEIPPVMITGHLVGSVDRHANKSNPNIGGSRNRYLSKETDGHFRLYKKTDRSHDGWDKTGLYCPATSALPQEYHHLVKWYKSEYFLS